MQLNQQALAAYRAQGFWVCHGVFNPHEMQALRLAADVAVQSVLGQLAQATEYRLDGNRFVDIGHITAQFEHAVTTAEDSHAQLITHNQQQNLQQAFPVRQPPQSQRLRDQQVRVIEPINDVSPEFDALLDDPRLVSPMQQLIGQQTLALWTAKLNCKLAGGGSGFGWHQDSPYWLHDSGHVDLLPNVMLAIDDADRANGCLRVIPRSHLKGPLPGCQDQRQLAGFYTDPAAFDEGTAVAVELQAGSAVLFDPHLIHGSGSNTSSRQRRALIATYQPAGFAALKSGRERPIKSAPG